MTNILICFALGLSQILQPPPPSLPRGSSNSEKEDSRTAVIRGRVVAADTGQPLQHAIVRTGPESREMATTDAAGRYELKDLAAGTYLLTAGKGSYVTITYGQRRFFGSGRPIEIREGQTLERIDFVLPPGGVITGRIIDERGDPVVGLRVVAMRYQYVDGRRQMVLVSTAMTNDLGEYRLHRLQPGYYYISAGLLSVTGNLLSSDDGRNSLPYLTTFYPGVSRPADAERLTLDTGQTLGNIDLTLKAGRLARLSGSVHASDGQPMAGAAVMVKHGVLSEEFAVSANVEVDGSFVISNVVPDETTIVATGLVGFDPIVGLITETASITLTVSGEDVTDLQLVGVAQVRVTGRVVIRDGSVVPRDQIPRLEISTRALAAADPFAGAGRARVTINDDLTFELRVAPTRLMFGLEEPEEPDAARPLLKAVRWRGRDVTDTGIDVRRGEVSGIEIELTNRRTDVSGLVTDRHGAVSRNYTVVIFPRDPARWYFKSRYVSAAEPDKRGRFSVCGLPPGEYYAIAVDYVEPGQESDPEYLKRIWRKAILFSLGEGEIKALDLMIQQGGEGVN